MVPKAPDIFFLLKNSHFHCFLFRKTAVFAPIFPLFPYAPDPVVVKIVVTMKTAPENRRTPKLGSGCMVAINIQFCQSKLLSHCYPDHE